MNDQEPDRGFALAYMGLAEDFLGKVRTARENQIQGDKTLESKLVVKNYYQA